ncbi:unnamed protein product, partial [Ectocarpus sp. 4 AP-2014]
RNEYHFHGRRYCVRFLHACTIGVTSHFLFFGSLICIDFSRLLVGILVYSSLYTAHGEYASDTMNAISRSHARKDMDRVAKGLAHAKHSGRSSEHGVPSKR